MVYKGSLSTKKEVVLHLGFWLLYAYFTMIRFEAGQDNYFRVAQVDLFSATWIIVFVATFYFNYLLVLPRVFRSFKWGKAILGLLLGCLFFIGMRFFVEQFLTLLLFDVQNYYEETAVWYYFYDNLYYSSKPIILSSILFLIVFIIRLLEYNKHILEAHKDSEVKFLKAQINPHFIFNTLNNIYSMVYFESDKSLPAIEKLSRIMRFTTYESQKEKIKLEEEINYIKSYIELERLRHQENSFVNLIIQSNNNTVEIPPYLLSPLVENAIKHGSTTNGNSIEVKLTVDKEKLQFMVKNEIGNQKKDKLGGIGIDNLQKRLEIYYPKKHVLTLINENNIFTAELELDLT